MLTGAFPSCLQNGNHTRIRSINCTEEADYKGEAGSACCEYDKKGQVVGSFWPK